ncbi:hypothetical protein [Streptomyces litchfieldiae]|uniref:Uncharacterized protein n=1 Tax=Streptomyces litchfieldiae TaxID=3075543 RepID=A0ABU2MUK8_9ACTN|nr:hypothetical protein [Streptomyces sp. DSM 44938]MDT0345326.1 hypothetical protein [Streptomyces sp. DSM 44938]
MICPCEPIAYGPPLSDNGTTRLGAAALVRARAPGTARADIEVHNGQSGGRPT